jgi:hypothetical protein
MLKEFQGWLDAEDRQEQQDGAGDGDELVAADGSHHQQGK